MQATTKAHQRQEHPRVCLALPLERLLQLVHMSAMRAFKVTMAIGLDTPRRGRLGAASCSDSNFDSQAP